MSWWGKYIGLPYDEAHCWELVRRIYADRLGVDLPTYGEIDARDLIRVARAMEKGKRLFLASGSWRMVQSPEPLDVVLMRGRSHLLHVGVATDHRHVIHTEIATGAVLMRMDDIKIRGRITGYGRLQT